MKYLPLAFMLMSVPAVAQQAPPPMAVPAQPPSVAQQLALGSAQARNNVSQVMGLMDAKDQKILADQETIASLQAELKALKEKAPPTAGGPAQEAPKP